MSLHTGCLPWQKLTQKIAILIHACRLTVVGLLFVFVLHGAGIRRATYLCLDCAKNVDKNWNITVSFIIHVNFDHAWAEHYLRLNIVCSVHMTQLGHLCCIVLHCVKLVKHENMHDQRKSVLELLCIATSINMKAICLVINV